MTKLLDQAIEAARNLPPAMQDEMARVIIAMTGDEPPAVQLTPEEEASFEESLAQAERGEIATDDQVRAIWAEHGLWQPGGAHGFKARI